MTITSISGGFEILLWFEVYEHLARQKVHSYKLLTNNENMFKIKNINSNSDLITEYCVGPLELRVLGYVKMWGM